MLAQVPQTRFLWRLRQYTAFLNLAPLEFGEVVGLYVATLFIVWQAINFAFFRTLPTLPVLVGEAKALKAAIIVTDRNLPVRNLYRDNGFLLAEDGLWHFADPYKVPAPGPALGVVGK